MSALKQCTAHRACGRRGREGVVAVRCSATSIDTGGSLRHSQVPCEAPCSSTGASASLQRRSVLGAFAAAAALGGATVLQPLLGAAHAAAEAGIDEAAAIDTAAASTSAAAEVTPPGPSASRVSCVFPLRWLGGAQGGGCGVCGWGGVGVQRGGQNEYGKGPVTGIDA